ncbi:MAG: hypothetical protein IJO08_02915 [Clostridia bacterium]|nr:hypothetical protein [Clostridia bacterium]
MRNTTVQRIAQSYAEKVTRKPLAIELDPRLQLIAEQQARASHEGWRESKIAQGYTYGPVNNDDPAKGPLTNPNLIPYDELDEETKQSNIANAVSVLKILQEKGCSFVSFTQVILYPLAKQIHDEWAREKIRAGWVYGEVTDKANKIHRDLVPFETLLVTHPEDVTYDVDTARQILIKMLTENDTYVLITNLANFKLDAAPALA